MFLFVLLCKYGAILQESGVSAHGLQSLVWFVWSGTVIHQDFPNLVKADKKW